MNLRAARVLPCWLLLTFACALRADPAPPAAFHDAERWCAVGDSITHTGLYHDWINLYYITRFPEREIIPFNDGISGDRAEAVLQRLSWDILPHHPSVATVLLGMNDVERPLYENKPPTPEILAQRAQALDLFRRSERELVTRLQQAGTRVVLLTPSPYDDTADLVLPAQAGVNRALQECTAFLTQLAAETGAALVDFHTPMTRINREQQRTDPAFSLIGPDRIHPAATGHLVMAYLFLKAQQVPAEVSYVAIDARDKHVLAERNGRAGRLKNHYNGFEFEWLERALPFPIDDGATPALALVPFMTDLNQETLRVTGLKPGHYLLRIDEEDVRVYSTVELAAGVNLALESVTPQARQAAQVMDLLKQRANVVAERLRRIAQLEHQTAPEIPHPVTVEQLKPFIEGRLAFPRTAPATKQMLKQYPEWKAGEAKFQAEADRLLVAARAAARPVAHDYRLVRQE